MNKQQFDDIARLRFDAARFRALARQRTKDRAALLRRPIGSRDALEHLKLVDRISEYTMSAARCDAEIANIRRESLAAAQQLRSQKTVIE